MISSSGVSSSKSTTRRHALEGADHLPRARLVLNGRRRALEPLHRRVRVERDDQPVADRRRLLDQRDMPGCSRSKQPLVKPTVHPCASPGLAQLDRRLRSSSRPSRTSVTCAAASEAASSFRGQRRRAERLTTMPAAWLAIFIVSMIGSSTASPRRSPRLPCRPRPTRRTRLSPWSPDGAAPLRGEIRHALLGPGQQQFGAGHVAHALRGGSASSSVSHGIPVALVSSERFGVRIEAPR